MRTICYWIGWYCGRCEAAWYYGRRDGEKAERKAAA